MICVNFSRLTGTMWGDGKKNINCFGADHARFRQDDDDARKTAGPSARLARLVVEPHSFGHLSLPHYRKVLSGKEDNGFASDTGNLTPDCPLYRADLHQAHSHARGAVAAIDTTTAIGEHNLAAAQYASASKGTDSSEVPHRHGFARSI